MARFDSTLAGKGAGAILRGAVSFSTLRLPPDLIADLERWGLASPDQLALLVAAHLEVPAGVALAHGMCPAGELLRRMVDHLYQAYVVAEVRELETSVTCLNETRTYRVRLTASNSASNPRCRCLGSTRRRPTSCWKRFSRGQQRPPGGLPVGAQYENTVDPFADLAAVLDLLGFVAGGRAYTDQPRTSGERGWPCRRGAGAGRRGATGGDPLAGNAGAAATAGVGSPPARPAPARGWLCR